MNNYDFSRQQDESKFQHLVRVSVDKLNKLHNKDWTDIKEEFDFEHSSDSLRKYATGWKLMVENADTDLSKSDNDTAFKYKEVTEILADGSQRSDKLISMSNEQLKDSSFLLKAHGFDENEWEVSNAKNSIWNIGSEKTLYSSRISVKPRVNGFDVEKFIARINDKIKPIHIDKKIDKGDRLLEIPLFDMHWGIGNLEVYKPTLHKVLDRIQSRNWDKILFVIGQDLIHTDGFTGQTTSGTIIGKVDVEKAWSEAFEFYSFLINNAIEKATIVDVVFSDGNHDQAMGWAFVKALEVKYPQVNFDTQMKKFKAFTWKDVFIGITHGDKAANRLQKVFLAEYGKLIASAKVKEIQSGHLHHERSKDDFGIVQRTLGSGVPTDDYHADNGFVGSVKSFQIFEYSKDSLEAIYYV